MDGGGQLIAGCIHRVFGDTLLLIRDAVAVGPEKQHRIGIRHRLRTVGCDCRLRGAAGDHDRAVRELVLDHVHQPGASRGLRPIRVLFMIIGLFAAFYLGLKPGGTIVLVGVAALLIIFIGKRIVFGKQE